MNNKKQNNQENAAVAEQIGNAQPQVREINGGVSAEQIAVWKSQHGRIVEVCITDEESAECHVGYFHRPDMKTMQAVNATSKTNEVKASEVMFDNCWLGGSPMLQSDAILKMEAMATLGSMFGKCVRTLKTCRGVPDFGQDRRTGDCERVRLDKGEFPRRPRKLVDGRVGDVVSAGVLVGKRTSVEPRKDIIQTFSPCEHE